MTFQKTIGEDGHIEGAALHSGHIVNLVVKGAPEDTGIVFRRIDLSPPVTIEATIDNIAQSHLATVLEKDGAIVGTIEHLMAAFFSLGISNAIVEIDSSEAPIMDGSALPFISLLKKAGIVTQRKSREFIKIMKPVAALHGDAEIVVIPAQNFEITYSIDFGHHLAANQSYQTAFSPELFEREITPARTFGFLKDVDMLKANGLAKGGSLDNSVVLGNLGILNDEGLRFPDEFCRHKILDLVGDLALLEKPIIGHVIAHKSGHGLHHRLMRGILDSPDHWCSVEVQNLPGKSQASEDPPSYEVLSHVSSQLHP